MTTSRWLVVAVAALCGIGILGGCTTSKQQQETVTVTTTVAPSTSGSTTNSESSALSRNWKTFSRKLSAPVGVSIVAVGKGNAAPINLGDQTTRVAWSTIKVPLAIAAELRNGPMPATVAAIEQSDNASAEALWTSLGTASQASAAVMKVLAEGGDSTQVPATRLRAGFTIFGQTQWPLPAAASFTAHVPCMPGSQRVLKLMGNVAANQQWGVEVMKAPRMTAVKGGWGPGPTSGYVVRQIGVITAKNGSQTAIALSTLAPGSSLGSGTSVLNQVAQWLNTNIDDLPHGTCAR